MTKSPELATREFVPLVALLLSLVALSIDAMLPALPAIGRDLGATGANDAQFVITALFVGLGVGQAIFGPLSDRIGRRPAILLGLILFMAGCVVSLLAATFPLMIGGRILQGFGAAAPRIVTLAMVRDQYGGRRMARIVSFALAVFILVPTVAPALGQGLQALGSWRTIFAAFLAIAAVALAWFAARQPETLSPDLQRPLRARDLGRAVLEVLRIRAALGATLAIGFVFAPFIAYLSSAQQIFQEAYRTGTMFPFWFGVLSLAIGAASLLNGRLVMRYGMARLTVAAAIGMTLVSGAGWALATAWDGLPPFGWFLAALVAVFLALGLLFGNLNALAMEPLGHIAGLGAAVVASLSMLLSVPLGAWVGQAFDGAVSMQMAAFTGFGAATLVAVLWARERPADEDHG